MYTMNPAVFILLIICAITIDAAFDANNPMRKTWWAKRIANDFYTAGRISARQIKYAQEDGFKSIISVINFTEPLTNGLEEFPTSTDCQEIAKNAGIRYEVVVPPSGNWKQDLEFVRLFTILADSLPKPLLVHCGVSYAATFSLLNYFANKYRNDSTFTPKVDGKTFFEIASMHGMNYNEPEFKQTVSLVTGEDISGNVAVPDIPMGQWWWPTWQIKPVYKNMFVAGQIHFTSLAGLNSTGFKSLINHRRGVTLSPNDPTPSQEEASLLNIRDQTGTYAEGGRQNITRLLATRIDPSRPNTYISNTSLVNYEARNQLEFGDDVGYNETMERQAVEAAGLKYYHHPTG
ncbi:unnamed protein product [Owenia fusiformis]|uniref:Uncharacterized protein n=1 Tax=Owenia fusiformis TaxID=6347 RepID=A0A8S4NPE7_OWEFU|nr:unnamed protein product [Owenia fusiformis]